MAQAPRWATMLAEEARPDTIRRFVANHGPVLVSFFGLLALLVAAGLGANWANDYVPEAAGIFFTVAVIDFMLERRDKRRAYPARYAAYLEANSICNSAAHLWFEMVRAASVVAPKIGDDLLSSTYVELVSELDINAPVGEDELAVWALRVSERCSQISTRVERLIQRYQVTLEGELLTSLRILESSGLVAAAPGFPMMFHTGKKINVRYRVFQPALTNLFVVALEKLGSCLAKLSVEFRLERDFRPPCDLSYISGLERLHLKDDIAPKIGTGRFDNQSWQPRFANFLIGDGPPPP